MTSPSAPSQQQQQPSPAEAALAASVIAGTTLAGLEALGFPAALAMRLKNDQAAIGDLTARQAAAIFAEKFDPASARESWPDVMRLLAPLIAQRRATSIALATRGYQMARMAAGPGVLVPMPVTPALSPGHVDQLAASTGLGTFLHEVKQGQDPQAAVVAARQSLGVASATAVLDGGRQQVLEAVRGDSQASGWMRLARPDACPFCRLLSGRVYPRDNAGFPAHNHCQCYAVPVFGLKVTPVGAQVRKMKGSTQQGLALG